MFFVCCDSDVFVNTWICQLHTHTHTHPFYTFKKGLSWLPILSWPQFTDQCDPNPISLHLFTVSGFQRVETIHSTVFHWEAWKARQWSLSGCRFFSMEPLAPADQQVNVFLHRIFNIMLREHRLKKSRSPFPRRSVLHVAPTHKHHPPTKAAAVAVYDMTKASQIKWRMTKGREKKEDVSLRHIKGVALFTCVGLLLHGRWDAETTPAPIMAHWKVVLYSQLVASSPLPFEMFN